MMITDIVPDSTDPEAAWQRVLEQHRPTILALCRHASLQQADADDVIQQVLLAVYKGIGKLRLDRPGDSFRGWLNTITANKIKCHYRQLRNASEQFGEQFDAPCAAEAERGQVELANVLLGSLVDAAQSVSCRNRNNAVVKCIALALWNIGEVADQAAIVVADLVEEIIRRLSLDIAAANHLRSLAASIVKGEDLPDALDNFRRRHQPSIWSIFKSALKVALEVRLGRSRND
jgi:RNA polymerase sigma factor (sigma-70 family)